MDTLQTIELCKNLFYVFAGVAAVSFLLSVYLFFKFDIPYTYSMLTGKAKKRTIEQMEKQKFQTGKLRMNFGNTGDTKPHTKRQGKTGGMTGQTGYTPTPPPPAPYSPPPAPPQPEYRPETQVLSVAAPETQVLHGEEDATMILNAPQEDPCTEELSKTTLLKPEPEIDFLFQITEETMSINTNELI